MLLTFDWLTLPLLVLMTRLSAITFDRSSVELTQTTVTEAEIVILFFVGVDIIFVMVHVALPSFTGILNTSLFAEGVAT